MGILIYLSTVSGNMQIKKKQDQIRSILEGKKIEYMIVDISTDTVAKERMREMAGKTSLPPQIEKDGEYLGDYEKFIDSVEFCELDQFLRLSS